MTHARIRTLSLLALLVLPLAALAHGDWKAPPEAHDRKNPLPSSEETIARGRAVYVERCIMCHGTEGRGDGKASAFLRVKPHDLLDEGVQAQTDGELFWKVTQGKMPMPSFRKKLSDEERWLSVVYVRALGAMHGGSSAAAEPDATGPE